MRKPSVERRKYKRLKLEVKVELQYYNPELGRSEIVSDIKSKNISAGGVLVQCGRRLSVEDFVIARFVLPSKRRYIMGLARVVRVEVIKEGSEYEVGLEFVNFRKEDVEELNKFVEQEAKE
ncbi:MAG: PilZ domain-containing protein [Planctomycetota bacterium]|nr:PilZ domain-containing protein [Planctomycetota bacterium]